MQTWYHRARLKTADALPDANDYPETLFMPEGFEKVDQRMKDETAIKQTEEHPDLSYLGAGGQGVAYVTKAGTVVKYTIHSNEAKAAQRVLDLQAKAGGFLPGIVGILQVKKIQERRQLWMIKMEKLAPIDTTQRWVINNLLMIFFEVKRSRRTREAVWKLCQDWATKAKLAPDEFRKYEKTFQRYFDMVENLRKAGLKDDDTHSENIGVRADGSFALFDLGYSV